MADGSLRRSFTTEAALAHASSLPEPSLCVRLLSPFDPALRDRARAERLFGSHYRIEIFIPQAKRQFGESVFPVLQGTRVIGRIDVKRSGSAHVVQAFWPEAGVRVGKLRVSGLVTELERVRAFAEVETVGWSIVWLRGSHPRKIV